MRDHQELYKNMGIDSLDFSKIAPQTIDSIVKMAECSFSGRTALQAGEVWGRMLKEKEITIWLTLAGAPVPSGMGSLLSHLIQERYIDVIISVGSQVFHDLHWYLGDGYYHHDPVNGRFADVELHKAGATRYHNVIASFEQEAKTGYFARDIWYRKIAEGRQYSSRELVNVLAKEIIAKKGYRPGVSFVLDAYKAGVPLITPTLHDSWLGCELAAIRSGHFERFENGELKKDRKPGLNVIYDALKDNEENAFIGELSNKLGLIIFGGGVPRNFSQQVAFMYNLLNPESKSKDFSYALKFSGDKTSLGGLSGSTIDEGVAWGKMNEQVRRVEVDGDATLLFPIAAAGLNQAISGSGLKRRAPRFDWASSASNSLKITY